MIAGGCYCGKIRFRTTAEPKSQANCHCENCRRAAGAQAVAWITVATSEVEFKKTKPRRYRTETGAFRTFCGSCGTSLTYEHDRRPTEMTSRRRVSITPKNFRQPETFFPRKSFPGSRCWIRNSALVSPDTLCWTDIPVTDLDRAIRFC